MNPTERARRSDAYYRDNVRRRELCDRISFLECDMEELKAENAKLRELCGEMLLYIAYPYVCVRPEVLVERARELGIEVKR